MSLDSRIVYVDQWSPLEEAIITDIMAREHVERIEAICRMRRRKLDDLEGRSLTPAQVQALRRLAAEGLALTLADVHDVCGWPRPENNATTRKGGRPRKYRTDDERERAKRRQQAAWQRGYRKRRSVEKNALVSV